MASVSSAIVLLAAIACCSVALPTRRQMNNNNEADSQRSWRNSFLKSLTFPEKAQEEWWHGIGRNIRLPVEKQAITSDSLSDIFSKALKGLNLGGPKNEEKEQDEIEEQGLRFFGRTIDPFKYYPRAMEQLNGEDDQENKNADARNDEVSEQLSQWQYYNNWLNRIRRPKSEKDAEIQENVLEELAKEIMALDNK